MLFFVPSSIGSCCFLLLVACLLGVSLSCLVSRVRESFKSSSLWFEQFGAWISLSLCVREREIEEEEMEDDALDRDARIKLSIGSKDYGRDDGVFDCPLGLVFDHRGLLLVSDTWNHRVQVFSCDDDGGSFVSKLGEEGEQAGQFQNQWNL